MFRKKPEDKKNCDRDLLKEEAIIAKRIGNQGQAVETDLEDVQQKDVTSVKKKTEAKKEEKRKRSFLSLFYDLLRQTKRILSMDRDKPLPGKVKTQEQERKEEREKIISQQQRERLAQIEKLRGKERGPSLDREQQKAVEEKLFRPVMHAKRAPGLQAGEKLPTEAGKEKANSGGLKHDFSGKPATAGLAKVIEEINEQHLGNLKPEGYQNRSRAIKDILNPAKDQGGGGGLGL